MSSSQRTTAWNGIAQHAKRVIATAPEDLLSDPRRLQSSRMRVGGILLDYGYQYLDEQALTALVDLAEEKDLLTYLRRVADSEQVNPTEHRAADHMALRAETTDESNELTDTIERERTKMFEFAEAVRQQEFRGCTGKPIEDVVHIGIGGSHLGPALVCDALADASSINIHYVTNYSSRSTQIYERLDPASTLFSVASKSYTTPETLRNASRARSLFSSALGNAADPSKHFVHITANREVDFENELAFYVPESVGGRFSLWSAMGLPIAIALGTTGFEALLEGARNMDRHALNTKPQLNAAILLALFTVWNTNFLGATSHLILPYHSSLGLFTRYVQQLEMESNGKSTTLDGANATKHTTPVIWGNEETDGQHAWHQLLHQGTHAFSADFVGVVTDSDVDSNQWNLANLLAQSELLFTGHESADEPHKSMPGHHSSSLLLLDELDAKSLGALIALYEHKVACLGHLWEINSFDQWGVEKGKSLADQIEQALADGRVESLPATTRELIHTIRGRAQK